MARFGGIKIYPNPAGDKLTIDNGQLTIGNIVVFEIYNVLGENVYSDVFNSKQKTVNCKQFSAGIYLIEVSNGDKVFRAKFVKE